VAVPRLVLRIGAGRWSGERGDVSVDGEDVGGGGPAVEDTDNVAAGGSDDAGGGMPELSAQSFE